MDNNLANTTRTNSKYEEDVLIRYDRYIYTILYWYTPIWSYLGTLIKHMSPTWSSVWVHEFHKIIFPVRPRYWNLT